MNNTTDDKTYTPITPQEALRVLADAGKPVEGMAFRMGHNSWRAAKLYAVDARDDGILPFFIEGGYWVAHCARVTVAPKIAQGHNPDGLTEEQVGVSDGWRLLTWDEFLAVEKVEGAIHGEFYNNGQWLDNGGAGYWARRQYTYRTKHPAGYYLPKPKKLAPWNFETAPKGCVMVRVGNNPDARLIIHWDGDGIATHVSRVTYRLLAEAWMHSTDSGASWHKCGTEETAA